jgi:FKBP-type peptidyl-prolyl cis-trans isomerase
MKRTLKYVVSGAALVSAVGLVGCNKAKLNTDQEKASYAIGQQIGRSLKMQNADVTVNSLEAGLKDAMDGKEPKLKPEEMQAALQKMQEASMKKAQEAAEVNLKKGDEWLANNAKQAGWTTTPSGLQIKMEKEGSGPTPKDTDIVKVHYTGMLTDGTKFDSSRDRNEPAEFPVNGVIPGWTEALKMMKAGTTAKLAIPSKLAYGPQGRPGIPANSVLLFDVELLEVKAPPAPAAKPKK